MSPDKPRGRPRQETASSANTTTSITADTSVYAVGDDGRVAEYRITRRTAKRTYFEIGSKHLFEVYVSRETLERDGSAQHVWEGQASRIYATRAAARKAAWRAGRRTPAGTGKAGPKPAADLIPAGITAIMPPAGSARNDSEGGSGDGGSDLWADLVRAEWSTSEKAYESAVTARRLIAGPPVMTVTAFAAEAKRQNITGWQSQGSVSRRLRWADLHDECWLAGILPKGVFLAESATRPLFGKLTKAERLKLLAELFGPHLSEELKRKLAAELSEALMREHLARQAGDSGPEYKAPRIPALKATVAKLLAHYPAEAIHEAVDHLDNSARNAAGRGA